MPAESDRATERHARRFYRLVSEHEPPLSDFRSLAEQGRVFDDPEVQRRAAEDIPAEEIRRWVVEVVGTTMGTERSG